VRGSTQRGAGFEVRPYSVFTDPILPASYIAELVHLLQERGIPAEATLEGTAVVPAGLDNPHERLSFDQAERLIANALRLSADPGLGLAFGERVKVSNLGIVGYAVMSQANLRDAIRVGERYHRAIVGHIGLALHVHGGRAQLRIDPEIPLGRYEAFIIEAVLTSLLGIGRFLLGRELPGLECHFRYPRPAHGDRYEDALGARCHFGRQHSGLHFDAAALPMPVQYACEASARMAEEQCENELAPLLGQQSVVRRVRSALRARPGDYPDMRELARELRTSERSLRRALSEHGTHYQQLLDETRLKLASEYLASTSLPVEEIARAVGFGSSRSFRRAYRRWTGHSPSSARDRDRES